MTSVPPAMGTDSGYSALAASASAHERGAMKSILVAVSPSDQLDAQRPPPFLRVGGAFGAQDQNGGARGDAGPVSLQRSEAGQGGGTRLAGVDADGGQVADGLPGRFVVHGDEGVQAGGNEGPGHQGRLAAVEAGHNRAVWPRDGDPVPGQRGRHDAVGVERLHADDGGASARTFRS